MAIVDPSAPVPAANAVLDNSGVLTAILICGVMGLVGQGIRAVVGLKKSAEAQDPATFNAAYLFVSMMIGAFAGILAGFGLGSGSIASLDLSNTKLLLGLLAAGYSGTDFIEGAMSKFIPGLHPDDDDDGRASDGSTSSKDSGTAGPGTGGNGPAPSAAAVVPPTAQPQLMLATHLVGSNQTLVSADDVIGMLNDGTVQRPQPTGPATSPGAVPPVDSPNAGPTVQHPSAPVARNKNWTPASLTKDMHEAVKYADAIRVSSQNHGLDPCLVCAVGSRESGWGRLLRPQGPGGVGDPSPRKNPTRAAPDGGWGRGLMQADYEASEFAKDPTQWKDPTLNVEFGCNELATDLAALRRRHPQLSPAEALKGAIAAYNTGLRNVEKSLAASRDVDSTTAGGDYASDVLSRAAWFKANGFEQSL